MKKRICLLLFIVMLITTACQPDSSTPTTAPPSTDTPTTIPTACNHRMGTVISVESTCTEGGYVESACTLCGEVLTVTLPSKGHSFSAPSCTVGEVCSHCQANGEGALGHDFINGKCSRCDAAAPTSPDCIHAYQATSQTTPTCTVSGSITYTCSSCGDIYTESLSPSGHHYTDATCEFPSTCTVCTTINGASLGHNYDKNYLCTRCGTQDPKKPVDFAVTIRGKKGVSVSGVTVSVYVNEADIPAGTAVTDSKGKATITLVPGSTYRVVLSTLPSGYDCRDSYTFRSLTANITLISIPVIDSTDHSQAQYKTGSLMGDFTLTDTDGKSYTLSQLLQDKNAVILNFWYVDCQPCKAEFPYFEEGYATYGSTVQLLTINPFDAPDAITQLKTEMGLSFPMLSDTIHLCEGFGLDSFPTTVVIGKNGRILLIHEGTYSRQEVMDLFASYAA